MKSKNLIFDAGPLINFAMNGSLYLLEELKKEFKGNFLITKEVKREIIDHPLTIRRFQLEALQLNELFNKEIIKYADITEEQVNELRNLRDRLMQTANNTFRAKERNLHLIDRGEAATLALSSLLEDAPIVVDERTTRMLCEAPENLRKLFEKKLHTYVKANKKNYKMFENFRIIRSTELVYIVKERDLFKIKDPRVYEAMLYGMKYKGCSISEGEIEEMVRL